jgi:hypothetical protein
MSAETVTKTAPSLNCSNTSASTRNSASARVTFHDLRGTAVLNLSLAAATVPEIATITGHKLGDVQSILDSNYFHRDLALAESGIAKLEEHQKARKAVCEPPVTD